MVQKRPNARTSRPPTRRAPPKLTLKKFLHDLWKTDRYNTFAGARRAVGRADDWTEEEREIGFAEIDKKFPDAPPRVRREVIPNADPMAPAAPSTRVPSVPPPPVRQYDPNVREGSALHQLYVLDHISESMHFYADLMKRDSSPELKRAFERVRQMHEDVMRMACERLLAARTARPQEP